MTKNILVNHNKSEYWENSYKLNKMGWDIGYPTPIFDNWIKMQKKIYSICVLGAGNGWDAANFAKYGHNVTAVDFSPTAVKNMEKISKSNDIKMNIINSNIFNLKNKIKNKFDLVVEYTCFCAIDPKNRIKYVDLVDSLLLPNGKLIAIFFPIDKNIIDSGPPFGVDFNSTLKLFSKKFSVIHKEFSQLSIKPRIGREIFTILQKNGI